MAHDQPHAVNATADHTPGTNGTLLGTESSAIAEKAFATAATASAIVQRGGTGQITLPTSNPTSSTDAAHKGYVDQVAQGHRSPVAVMRMIDDQLDQPPGGDAAGDAYVVGATPAGLWAAFATGDIVEYDGATWNLVLAGSGGNPANGARVVVKDSAAGSFLAQDDKIGLYTTGTGWSFTTPNDGDIVAVYGEQSIYENTQFIYDSSTTSWVALGSAVSHNNLSGLQGGTTAQYYHLNSSQHGETVRYKADVIDGSNNTPQVANLTGAGWVSGDRGLYNTTTNSKWWMVYYDGSSALAVRLS